MKSITAIAIILLTSCQMAVVNTGKQKRSFVNKATYVIYDVTEMTETNIRQRDTCQTHRYFVKAYNLFHPDNDIRFTTLEFPESDTLTIQIQ
jgi:hypothetical protein